MRGGADRVRVADRLNVAERLAEGRPAAEHTQSYVRACHLVGYQHPDLTAYPAQIHDWYGSEDGLDLHALDADCAQLRAAASVLMEALRMERSQVAVLAAAWTGSGADAAVHFVQRHCETGNSVVTEVRAAAQRCESLRDNLWQLVDSKVATAIAIDERALAQRPAWLAAAEALTTEGADRPTAVEVVRQQIQPYVDDDVRNDWLTTMRSTTAGVAASYDAVTDQLASAPRAHLAADNPPGAVDPFAEDAADNADDGDDAHPEEATERDGSDYARGRSSPAGSGAGRDLAASDAVGFWIGAR
ncbi:alanine and proline rich protein [Mycobacterium tuberculosis variant bovis B2 7505]|nr:alanine and proline rich protein [Mycobacterium tuberculosis variant bovis B2 7505]